MRHTFLLRRGGGRMRPDRCFSPRSPSRCRSGRIWMPARSVRASSRARGSLPPGRQTGRSRPRSRSRRRWLHLTSSTSSPSSDSPGGPRSRPGPPTSPAPPCPALAAAEMPLSVSNPLRRDSFWHLDVRCERVRVTGVEVCGFGASVPLESHGPLDTRVRVREPCHRGYCREGNSKAHGPVPGRSWDRRRSLPPDDQRDRDRALRSVLAVRIRSRSILPTHHRGPYPWLISAASITVDPEPDIREHVHDQCHRCHGVPVMGLLHNHAVARHRADCAGTARPSPRLRRTAAAGAGDAERAAQGSRGAVPVVVTAAMFSASKRARSSASISA